MAALVAMDDLRAIVEEFIMTERSYVSYLSTLISLFMPMYIEIGDALVGGALHKKLQDLFASWKQLHHFHRSLLFTIETRCLVGGSDNAATHVLDNGTISAIAVPAPQPGLAPTHNVDSGMDLRLKTTAANGLANVIKSLAPYFKLYSEYCQLYPQVMPLFAEARKQNDAFNNLVCKFEQNPTAQGLNIESI